MSTHTFKFLEIFPNYDSFKETILAQTILPESEIDEATLRYFWAIMYRSFGNVEVMYTVKQDFIDRFLNDSPLSLKNMLNNIAQPTINHFISK